MMLLECLHCLCWLFRVTLIWKIEHWPRMKSPALSLGAPVVLLHERGEIASIFPIHLILLVSSRPALCLLYLTEVFTDGSDLICVGAVPSLSRVQSQSSQVMLLLNACEVKALRVESNNEFKRPRFSKCEEVWEMQNWGSS